MIYVSEFTGDTPREEIYKLLTGYTAEYENGEFRHLESTPNRGSIIDDFGCQDERDDYFELMWGSSLLDIVSARGDLTSRIARSPLSLPSETKNCNPILTMSTSR